MGAPVEITVRRHLDPTEIAAIDALVGAAEAVDARPALDDHQRLELAAGGRAGFAAVAARVPGRTDRPIAYAQLSRGNDAWDLGLVVDPEHRADLDALGEAVLRPALDVVRSDGGGEVYWWAFEPTPAHQAVAARLGLHPGRHLHQLRRPLPTGMVVTITTRAFRPGYDDEAWLAVNNRAFRAHPEQGGWDLETLRARQAEPWFDPDGFLLHQDDGRLTGFCWTKVHPATVADPELGEIYVIAVDPDAHGGGLGRQLTLAGLASLAERGVPTGMLYVDASNTGAMALYRKLGFEVHHTNTAYSANLAPAPV